QIVHVGARIVQAQTEPDAGSSSNSAAAHRSEHMRRVQRTGSAGRSTRSANSGLVQEHENPLGFDSTKRNVAGIWQSRLGRTIATRFGNLFDNAGLEFVSKGADARIFIGEIG